MFAVTRTGGKFQRSFDGDPNAVPSRVIKPIELEALRIRGNRNIVPDEFGERLMQSSGESRVIVAIKLCLNPAGKVDSVNLIKASGYPGYDERILTETKTWQFKPYLVDGKAVPVCTALKFIYEQE